MVHCKYVCTRADGKETLSSNWTDGQLRKKWPSKSVVISRPSNLYRKHQHLSVDSNWAWRGWTYVQPWHRWCLNGSQRAVQTPRKRKEHYHYPPCQGKLVFHLRLFCYHHTKIWQGIHFSMQSKWQESLVLAIVKVRVTPPSAVHITSEETTQTHRMLPTSLPTLFAYAPWSLLSFVLRLILKNTSSPVELTTYQKPYTSIRQSLAPVFLDRKSRLLDTHLNIDRRVWVFWLDPVLRLGLLLFRHLWQTFGAVERKGVCRISNSR